MVVLLELGGCGLGRGVGVGLAKVALVGGVTPRFMEEVMSELDRPRNVVLEGGRE